MSGPDTFAPPSQADGDRPSSDSYRQILGSSALIAGASLINMVIGMVRAKAFAVLLGPAGFGLMGAFTALCDLIRGIASMGVDASGVRQVAESTASQDTRRIANTITVLRRTAVALGVLAAVGMAIGARPLARLTFGDEDYWPSVALLGLAVMFRIISDGQSALLQGMRRIGDMARINIYGAALGSVAGIALVWRFGDRGVAASLVALAAFSMLWSWHYSRRVPLDPVALTAGQTTDEVRRLLGLGFTFMFNAMLIMGAAYVVRLILIRQHGLEAAGLYSAAWTLGGIYVGVVLQAMSADFYPRLVTLVEDDQGTNRLVNEQAQVSLLLAATGVLATLSLAPIALRLFYSAEFGAATSMLQWICLGMAMRVFTWPMGYVIVARFHRRLFVAVELAWTVAYLVMAWFAIGRWGPDGAGIAFFGSYVFHALMLYPIVRRMTGFRWWRSNVYLAAWLFGLCAAIHTGFMLLDPWMALALGCVATLGVALWSIGQLSRLVEPERLPARVKRVLSLIDRAGALMRRKSARGSA